MNAPTKFVLVGKLPGISGSLLAILDENERQHYVELSGDPRRLHYAHKPVKLRSLFESQLLTLLEDAEPHPAAKNPSELRSTAMEIVSLVRSDDYVRWHSEPEWGADGGSATQL